MEKASWILMLTLLASVGTTWAGETPSQFTAWGTRGPELAPVEGDWTEVPAEPRKRALPKLSAKDKTQGFIVFQRRPQEYVYHDTVPAWHETGVKLQTFLAAGEYEPLTFALHALEDLKGCRVTVGEWKTKGGDTLPASHIDVRIVRSIRSKKAYKSKKDKRYFLQPFLLEKREPFDVVKGKTAQVWLTVKAPEKAKAGDYVGTVRVAAEGKTAARIPVLLRVLPFRLPPPPCRMGISVWKRGGLQGIIDQREHGINSTHIALNVKVVSRDDTFGPDDAAATRKSFRKGIAMWRTLLGGQKDRCSFQNHFWITKYWDHAKGWFTMRPFSAKVDADYIKAMRTALKAAEAEGVTLEWFKVMDEPGGHPDTMKACIYYCKLVKKHFPGLRIYGTIGGGLALGIDEIGLLAPYYDDFGTNRFTVGILKRFLKLKKTYGIGNAGSSGEAVGDCKRDRYMFGFYGWKTGAREIGQWAYAWDHPWKEPIRGNNGYVYLTDGGPLPSIPWEAIREGIDDYRYTDLLWRLITVARKSGNSKAKAAAEAGEKIALAIMGEIDFNYMALDKHSRSPAAAAATMEKWRWKTAAACLELLKHVPLEKALATPAKRPGPLEMPFPKTETAKLEAGPELLPNGGFENALKPWKGSRNKFAKAGTSAVDAAEHHSGGKSFKLVNPDDVDGQAVNVCVWGWGGPGPSMTLEAGKTYEFSAWIKSPGAKPKLRLALPKKAIGGQKGGAGAADEAGWSRQTLRVTMKESAKPGYIAVWLMGPGTIWCDDLSLREVKVPPFVLETDQCLVDGSDRAVLARVKQIGGSKPIQVNVQLPGAKGGAQTVTVPAGGRAEVEFDAAKLPLGEYKLVAQLVGGDFSRTLVFNRIRGVFDK